MTRFRRRATVACLVAAALVGPAAGRLPAGAGSTSEDDRTVAETRAFSGLGSWVDLYNRRPWRHPDQIVAEMVESGVQTIYLETSSYKFGKAIVHPKAVGDYLDLAHANDMTVVAWYVPSFKQIERDYRRSVAAIGFASPTGQTFDAFALDIEATVVSDVRVRNARTRRLSRAIRDAAGDDYPLGAIVPDPVGSVYWTDFPYGAVGRLFDVFMPMSYFTFRVDGARAVRRHVRANVQAVRRETRPDASVHPIGGIADSAAPAETKAYVRAVLAEAALGGSFYDFPTMQAAQWKPLQRLRETRAEPPEPTPPPIGHRHVL